MKQIKGYEFTVMRYINDYLNTGNVREFIGRLVDLENHIIPENHELLFKFETLVYTLPEIEKDLLLPKKHSNRVLLEECLRDAIAVKVGGELSIYQNRI